MIPKMNVKIAKLRCEYKEAINTPPKTNPLIILLLDSFKII